MIHVTEAEGPRGHLVFEEEMLRNAGAAGVIEETRGVFERSAFAEHLGLQLTVVEPDCASAVLPLQPWILGPTGGPDRGAIGALAETAAGAAASSAGYEHSEPVDLFISYVRTAPDHPLTADARVVRREGPACYCDVEIRDWERELVARASVTYRSGEPQD